ncbi:MAG: hypothetical protein E6J91_25790 [Deltaproteobacteria bacterium]|nr:MAG: hypothetical protein E6J91_25790 [Deltaproteobacteria bacterium]
MLDPDGVAISSAAGGQFAPRVTFLAGTALVVWEDRRIDPQGDIFGARVTIAGALTVVDAGAFSIRGAAPGQQNEPVVAVVKNGFLVAWTDGRNVNASGTDIFGQQVASTGVLSGAAFAISANPENEEAPALLDSTTETTRVAYTRVRADLQTVRVETRTIATSTTNGQSCSSNSQCSTGFCVDTKCCDTACGNDSRTDCQACAQVRTGQPDGTCALVPGPNISICRNYASTFCDLREYCTGTSPDCPPDIGRAATRDWSATRPPARYARRTRRPVRTAAPERLIDQQGAFPPPLSRQSREIHPPARRVARSIDRCVAGRPRRGDGRRLAPVASPSRDLAGRGDPVSRRGAAWRPDGGRRRDRRDAAGSRCAATARARAR